MENLKLFLKENRVKRENVFYAASEGMRDENGDAVMWELKCVSTDEDEKIRDECIKEAKRGVRLDYNLYLKKLAVASVVFPPLYNAKLQDSYEVRSPEELITKLLDNPGEYQELLKRVQKINGFDVSMRERVEEAKN